jgi:predicted amidohydrolase
MRAAAVQLTSTDDVDHNLETADRLTRAAARDGAQLIVLPEKWPALGNNETVRAGAERADDAIAWAKRTAAELEIDLVAGSIAILDGDRIRNTALHVDPTGEIQAAYTKMHLFDVEVGGRRYLESEHEDAGDAPVTTTVGEVRVGLAICYDLRFPTLFEALRADVIALPSAFTLATTRDHWDVLTRARAIEQQAFVIAANQFGDHGAKMQSGGRSMIVDPWGIVLAQAPDTETHVIAHLDLHQQKRIRAKLPALQHRRNEALV